MLIKAEYDHQICKAFQINPVNAIRLMNGGNALVLDVRESKDFNNGHIKEAINVPLSSLEAKLNDLDSYKDRSVLTYCISGVTSARACKILKRAGFKDVHNLEGGLNSWQEAKLPLENKK